MKTRAKYWILRPYLVSARWIEEESTILVTDTFCVLTSVIPTSDSVIKLVLPILGNCPQGHSNHRRNCLPTGPSLCEGSWIESIPLLLIMTIIIIFINCNWVSSGGSGYFTCIQYMKLVTNKSKPGGLHEACSCNLETWEPSQHLLLDTGKPRKPCVEVGGRRTFRILTSSQQSGI
jgi:hypothetical protein